MVFQFGLVVRIPGFHPGGPGSIPGSGNVTFCEFRGHSIRDDGDLNDRSPGDSKVSVAQLVSAFGC